MNGLGFEKTVFGLDVRWTWLDLDVDSFGLGRGFFLDSDLDNVDLGNGTLRFGLSRSRRPLNLRSSVLISFGSYHSVPFPCGREMEAMVVGAFPPLAPTIPFCSPAAGEWKQW